MIKLLHKLGRALSNLGKKMSSKTQLVLTQYAEATLPTVFGEFLTTVYRDQNQEESAILISYNMTPGSCPFVRVHSECFTGEVLGSLKCDCRDQLNLALAEIQKRGSGAIIYLRQEGRGIGLGNKIRAYHLQNLGADTIEANHQLGFGTDLRSFEAAALILQQRGVKEVILNTNNPEKMQALTDLGIVIRERVPSLAAVNKFNEDYLKTKMKKLGHQLNGLFH
jgi:GTP cyclohydrolase II